MPRRSFIAWLFLIQVEIDKQVAVFFLRVTMKAGIVGSRNFSGKIPFIIAASF